MRKILFRGKRVIDGKWVESCCPVGEMHSGTIMYDFIQKTICQYTGLEDKNGRKIFEGDIMKFSAYGQDYTGTVNIISGNTCILCSDKKASPFLDHAIEKYGARCIGNIFDNPELMGK